MAVLQVDVTTKPFVWWNGFPQRSQVIEKYLGTPATVVPYERLFSVSGIIVNKQRS